MAVASIIEQTYSDFELLLIDDGSVDESRDLEKYYQQLDKRIRLIGNQKHQGIVKCLNQGIELAQGKYLARMDADDISLPKRLEKQVKFLDTHGNYGLVSCLFLYSRGKQGYGVKALPIGDYEIKVSFRLFNPITHGSVMIRKRLLDKYHLRYQESNKYYEDFALWMKLMSLTKLKIINEPLYVWTRNRGGITARHSLEMKKGVESLKSRRESQIRIKSVIGSKSKYRDKKWVIDGQSYWVRSRRFYRKWCVQLALSEGKSGRWVNGWRLLYGAIS